MDIAHQCFIKNTTSMDTRLFIHHEYLRCLFESDCDLPPDFVSHLLTYGFTSNLTLSDQFRFRLILHFLNKLAKHNIVGNLAAVQSILLKHQDSKCFAEIVMSSGRYCELTCTFRADVHFSEPPCRYHYNDYIIDDNEFISS